MTTPASRPVTHAELSSWRNLARLRTTTSINLHADVTVDTFNARFGTQCTTWKQVAAAAARMRAASR